MKHEIIAIAASIILLLSTSNFLEFVRIETAEPIDEIQVTFRKPLSSVQMLISQCPLRFGYLDEFLDCREEILYKYR